MSTPVNAGLIVSLACFFIFNPFGPKPSESAVKVIRKAKGVAPLKLPKGVERGMAKILAPEASAIAEFFGPAPKMGDV